MKLKNKKIILLLNLILIGFIIAGSTIYYQLKEANRNLYTLLAFEKNKNQSVVNNMLMSYLNSGTIIDTSKIVNKINGKSFHSFIKKKRLILYFNENSCSACDQDLFNQLNQYSKKDFLENIIVLVPDINYKFFLIYINEYKLDLKTVFAYNGHLLNIDNNGRGTFFIINPDFSITDILIPTKPIDETIFDYLKIANEKTKYQ